MSALDLDALERRCRDSVANRAHVPDAIRRATGGYSDARDEETLALITRLRAAEARTAWQPIETAPLDEWVLVCGEGWLQATTAMYDEPHWWLMSGEAVTEVTRWMPIPDVALPAAPEAP